MDRVSGLNDLSRQGTVRRRGGVRTLDRAERSDGIQRVDRHPHHGSRLYLLHHSGESLAARSFTTVAVGKKTELFKESFPCSDSI